MRFLPIVMLIAFLNQFGNSPLLSSRIEPPWFIEHIAFESVNLPYGVSTSFVTDESAHPIEFIVFKNISSTPLLVVGKPQDNYTEFDITPFEFPSGTGPLYKVVNGQAYVWRIKYNHPGTGYYYAWFKESERDDSIWLYVNANQVWVQDAVIFDLEPRNQYGGDRPKDVQIPASQHICLSVIYGSERIDVPITISYTLNEEYRSFESVQRKQTFYTTLICLVSVSAIVLLTILLLTRLTASKSGSTAA
jgi:hypothetical protein